jgi:hypothetical protein
MFQNHFLLSGELEKNFGNVLSQRIAIKLCFGLLCFAEVNIYKIYFI